MSRRARIALELLGPSFVACVLIAACVSIVERDPTALGAVPLMLPFAYVFAGLPSIGFTLVLEVAFARGLAPGGWRAVRLAAVAGVASGLLVTLWFSPWTTPGPWPAVTGFGALGGATGGIVGLVVRARTRSLKDW